MLFSDFSQATLGNLSWQSGILYAMILAREPCGGNAQGDNRYEMMAVRRAQDHTLVPLDQQGTKQFTCNMEDEVCLE
jgi:hypothetical protein